jgi:transketolase
MLQTAVKAAERLAGQGLQTRVLSMHTLKPLDEAAVLAAARETACIATLEEHSINGGLGSAVAEVLAEAAGIKVPFKRLGVPPIFSPHIGSQEYMLQQHGLNEESVSNALKTLCQQSR